MKSYNMPFIQVRLNLLLAHALHQTIIMTAGFLMYCFTVLVFSLIMIYVIVPRYGRSNPIIYVSICSLVGSVSVMAIKGFGVAVKLTLGGKNQFTHPSTYIFGFVVALCIVVQMNYFNKALDTFSTNVSVDLFYELTFVAYSIFLSVNPMYYVGFSSATIVASLILFQGFNTTGGTNTLSLLMGFIVTFLGVHLLNYSRSTEPPLDPNNHTALEGGLLNPRLSLQGRASLENWNGLPGDRSDPSRTPGHHRRGSSIYRNQVLFNAHDELDVGLGESVGLHDLREEEEESSDDDADERTPMQTVNGHAKPGAGNTKSPHLNLRSHSSSPLNSSLSDVLPNSRS
jgi:hypothetical protein